MTFGELRDRLKNDGYGPARMAKMIGVTHAAVSQFIHGRMNSKRIEAKIISILDLPAGTTFEHPPRIVTPVIPPEVVAKLDQIGEQLGMMARTIEVMAQHKNHRAELQANMKQLQETVAASRRRARSFKKTPARKK